MFDVSAFFNSISDFWSRKFKDKGILDSIYSFIGSSLGDSYGDMLQTLGTLSLRDTSLYRQKQWCYIDLEENNRLVLGGPTSEFNEALIVYGLPNSDFELVSCHRIYRAPTLEGNNYLEVNLDFSIANINSPIIATLSKRFNKSHYFSRYPNFLILYNIDPLLEPTWSSEPNPELFLFRLGFSISKDLLSADEQTSLKNAKTLSLEIDNFLHRVETLFIEENEDSNTLEVFIDPQDNIRGLASDTLKVLGITTEPITSKLEKSFFLDNVIQRVWCLSPLLDYYELSKKYGWILNPENTTPFRSTDRARRILVNLQEIGILGTSKSRLLNLGHASLGVKATKTGYDVDPPIFMDLTNGTLKTNNELYKVNTNLPLSNDIVRSSPKIRSLEGFLDIAEYIMLGLGTYETLVESLFSQSKSMDVHDKLGTPILRIQAILDNNSMLALKLPSYTTEPDDFISVVIIGYGTLHVPDTDFSVIENIALTNYSQDTNLNTLFRVLDYNTSGNWWQDSGIAIPKHIWNTTPAIRRRVNSDVYHYIIGEMPLHLIGDYDFSIPTSANETTALTSYKLFRDFLTNKICIVDYNFQLLSSLEYSIGDVTDVAERVIPLGKELVGIGAYPLAEFLDLAQDTLSIFVMPGTGSNLDETINVASYPGIGGSAIQVVLQVVGVFTIADTITISGVSFTVVNYVGSNLILDFQGSSISLNLLNSTTQVTNSTTNNTYNFSSGFITNVIGSGRSVLAVGNVYPEYTRHHPFSSNTIGTSLTIEIL